MAMRVNLSQLTQSRLRFGIESNARFKDLDYYMAEKARMDPFVLHGHHRITEQLDWCLDRFRERFTQAEEIHLLDVGPAIGAISTFAQLKILKRHRLLHKLKLSFVDVVPQVLDKTAAFRFDYPDFLDPEHEIESDARRLFAAARMYHCPVAEIPQPERTFDIVISGYVFHHMHPEDQQKSANRIGDVMHAGAFLGVTDEFFQDYENDFARKHAHDAIPIPIEAPIRLETLLSYFEPHFQLISAHYNFRDHYAFVCLRDGPDAEKIYISKPLDDDQL